MGHPFSPDIACVGLAILACRQRSECELVLTSVLRTRYKHSHSEADPYVVLLTEHVGPCRWINRS